MQIMITLVGAALIATACDPYWVLGLGLAVIWGWLVASVAEL